MSANSFDTLQACLATMAGKADHVFPADAIELVSSSAALLGSSRKAKLKLFEAVGDNAISMAVATRCLHSQLTAQAYQEARSVVTSNTQLSMVFVNGGFTKFVAFAGGVSPGGKAGANAIEAFAAVIYADLGMNGVMLFCENSGMFARYTEW